MLLGEPPRSQYDLNFSLFGIPTRVHPFFWLIALVMGSQLRDPIFVLIWVVAVFVSVLIHELGHALVMRRYGYYPWITLYGMGGLTSHNQDNYGYSRGSESLRQVLISLAGPMAGFLLAAAIVLIVFLTGYGDQVYLTIFGPAVGGLPSWQLTVFVNFVLFISVVWGMINLLPIYPLDGGQIAREFFLKLSTQQGIRQSLMVSIVCAVLMAAAGLLLLHSFFTALLFGYLAFSNYATLQVYNGRRLW